jgi:hypothetical protein
MSARTAEPAAPDRAAIAGTTHPGPHAVLERRYRRLLACYPRFFRRDSEDELLAVLMACARPGQRWPGPAEYADLLGSAVRLRLGPGRSSPPRTVTRAVRLMRVGAAAEIAGLIIALGTASSVQSALVRQHVTFLAGQWHDLVLFIELAVPVPIGLWLWLAWANGRGHRWARSAFVGVFGTYTLIMLTKLAAGAASYAPADLLVVGVQWLIGLTVVLLLFTPSAGTFFRDHQSMSPAAAHDGFQ